MSIYRYGIGGKSAHRADRCGKVAMVRLCTGCSAVAWGPSCDACGLKLDGQRAELVRQGSVRHVRSVIERMRRENEISDDAAAKIVAEMLGEGE